MISNTHTMLISKESDMRANKHFFFSMSTLKSCYIVDRYICMIPSLRLWTNLWKRNKAKIRINRKMTQKELLCTSRWMSDFCFVISTNDQLGRQCFVTTPRQEASLLSANIHYFGQVTGGIRLERNNRDWGPLPFSEPKSTFSGSRRLFTRRNGG